MFMGINGTEMVILVVVALVVIGPKRLPEYAQKLRELVRQMRRMAEGAKDSVQRDFGDDFKDVDWQKLDPRQYDPRRIVREALVEEDAAIRESKRRERSSLESSTTSDEADDQAASASAERSEASAMREKSPIERFQAQTELRDRSTTAPFDPEAT
jgi:sec-independent protein translocase protein TatB